MDLVWVNYNNPERERVEEGKEPEMEGWSERRNAHSVLVAEGGQAWPSVFLCCLTLLET